MGVITSVQTICPICQSHAVARSFTAREMMYGTRERFTYVECAGCGTLRIAEIPADLARFYPADYYSLTLPRARKVSVPYLRRRWTAWLVSSPGPVARALVRCFTAKSPFFHWARLGGARLESSILDVGCGSGGLLRRMQRYGFSNLTGIDPYTAVEIDEPGLRIVRAQISEVTGRYDLIMLHHVLEHVEAPALMLKAARERLNRGGRILLRLPIAGSHASREYGADWYNLDAPRHLVIPSLHGIKILAEKTGFTLLHTEFDSRAASFLMSENYRRDISSRDAAPATPEQKRIYRELAHRLNAKAEGDLGVFVLAPR